MLLEVPRKQWARDLASLIADQNRGWVEAVEEGRIADAAMIFSTLFSTQTLAMVWFSKVICRHDAQAIADADLFYSNPNDFQSRAIAADPCNTLSRRYDLHDRMHSLNELLTGMENADGAVN